MHLQRASLERQVLRERRVRFFPAVRFKPGTAGWEGRTLPLRYAIPPESNLSFCDETLQRIDTKAHSFVSASEECLEIKQG